MGTGRSGMARYVVDAVVLEGRSAREVAQAHGISKSWIYELIARYQAGGYQAHSSPGQETALMQARHTAWSRGGNR